MEDCLAEDNLADQCRREGIQGMSLPYFSTDRGELGLVKCRISSTLPPPYTYKSIFACERYICYASETPFSFGAQNTVKT